MSELVIKPVLWKCPRCDSIRPLDMGPHGICVHPAPKERGYVDSVAVDVPLYTRDDLVRAIEAAMVAASYSGDIKGHATRVVDRLTKGET